MVLLNDKLCGTSFSPKKCKAEMVVDVFKAFALFEALQDSSNATAQNKKYIFKLLLYIRRICTKLGKERLLTIIYYPGLYGEALLFYTQENIFFKTTFNIAVQTAPTPLPP